MRSAATVHQEVERMRNEKTLLLSPSKESARSYFDAFGNVAVNNPDLSPDAINTIVSEGRRATRKLMRDPLYRKDMAKVCNIDINDLKAPGTDGNKLLESVRKLSRVLMDGTYLGMK
jgi:hypothetical protein